MGVQKVHPVVPDGRGNWAGTFAMERLYIKMKTWKFQLMSQGEWPNLAGHLC